MGSRQSFLLRHIHHELRRRNLTGFKVVAKDGPIGVVDRATDTNSRGSLVVDARRMFGKKLVLPVGMIDRVEMDSDTVLVELTKREIQAAPVLDETPRVSQTLL
jgi:hypothetical protein